MTDDLVEAAMQMDYIAERIRISHTGCWVWQLKPGSHGYGQATWRCRNRRAHRLAYEAFVGPIPHGLTLDHLCRVKLCCNPRHLEPVTSRENTLRGVSLIAENARKTHCKRGHLLDGANLYIAPSRPGQRRCRKCQRMRKVAARDLLAGRAAGGEGDPYLRGTPYECGEGLP